ncbi:unnamed protein product [Ectocarpus sp. CCAP 1310/34]|nr:unnamed protein product [Ectocarpus sp. CCAP 1310/34]
MGLSPSVPSTVAGTLTRGKVNREVLDEVFGPSLLGILEAARTKDKDSPTMDRRQPRVTGSTANTSSAAKGGGDLKAEEQDEEDHYNDNERLQVVVSEPTVFVSLVETILGEMGIPSSAIVLLD